MMPGAHPGISVFGSASPATRAASGLVLFAARAPRLAAIAMRVMKKAQQRICAARLCSDFSAWMFA